MPDTRLKEKWEDPAFRSGRRQAMKEAWTPGRKEQASKRMLGHRHSDATINKISLSNIETWRRNERLTTL